MRLSRLSVDVQHGNCKELIRLLPDNSVDCLVTDPPYEYGFMGRVWDGSGIAFDVDLWREVLRVLKPGAHSVVFGAERKVHRVMVAIEDAGHELRHLGMWASAQSFPKSLDVGKAIDERRDEVRAIFAPDDDKIVRCRRCKLEPGTCVCKQGPITEEALIWNGWGTALKTLEPWVLARKPLEGTVAENFLKYGVGGLNIEACRLPSKPKPTGINGGVYNLYDDPLRNVRRDADPPTGRWPATLVCSDLDLIGPLNGVRVLGDGGTSHELGQRLLTRGGIGYGSSAYGNVGVLAGDDGELDGILGPYTKHFRIPGCEDTTWLCVPDELVGAILPTAVICQKASAGEREMGCDDLPEQWVDPDREEDGAGRNNPRAGAGRKTKRRNVHPCLRPGSLVFTEHGWREIETISVGSKVLGADGNLHAVVDVTSHFYGGPIYRIGVDDTFVDATDNHPFLVLRGEVVAWIEADQLMVGDYAMTPLPIGNAHNTVKPWENAVREAATTVASDTQPPMGITELCSTDDCAWPMSSNGNGQTDQFRSDSRSTTRTKTSKTIACLISNFSMPLHTSGFTPVANCGMASGGSHVACVVCSSLLIQNIGTSPPRVGSHTDDVSRVTLSESLHTRDFALHRIDRLDRVPYEGSVWNLTVAGSPTFQTKIGVSHNTVKPISLLRHLIRMVCPPGGLVLDLFCGSGSGGVAATWERTRYLGYELYDDDEHPYVRIARARIAYAQEHPATPLEARIAKSASAEAKKQLGLF